MGWPGIAILQSATDKGGAGVGPGEKQHVLCHLRQCSIMCCHQNVLPVKSS